MKPEIFDDFTIRFQTCFDVVDIKCVKFEKLSYMCEVYCQIKNIDFNSVIFIFNGTKLSED